MYKLLIFCAVLLSSCDTGDEIVCSTNNDCPDDLFCSTVKRICVANCTIYDYMQDDCPQKTPLGDYAISMCLAETREGAPYNKCVSDKTYCQQTCGGCCSYNNQFTYIATCFNGGSNYACGRSGVTCVTCTSNQFCRLSTGKCQDN